ncbi:hypothetical protein B0H66DRAFT_624517 [Apodospora peruviana]|uniref:Uncharacterized protein n=1 Tax=Apodospora peruviana TaxID=516989 RepID=A0AAE0I023_9PEZI|nr:hypothetical protein B0H66DRAFT_624517 [Apodospora peruviana]
MAHSHSWHSKVGLPNDYENDNPGQRNISPSQVEEMSRHTGINIKGYRLQDRAAEVNRLHEQEIHERQISAMKKDPTLAATLHGNKPHKGAMIDKEIMEEEEEIMRKKNMKKGSNSMTGATHM